eukprot:4389364-Karenia_brevis.AAC.1
MSVSGDIWAFLANGHATPVLFDEIGVASNVSLKAFNSHLMNTVLGLDTTSHASPVFDAIAVAINEKE